ncbi:hypothetical protein DFH06DRAFT_1139871 [Mycena polygramma]|nr:hypothetical protein DFH06DRAFT_1139871 [Mycena polygramma]
MQHGRFRASIIRKRIRREAREIRKIDTQSEIWDEVGAQRSIENIGILLEMHNGGHLLPGFRLVLVPEVQRLNLDPMASGLNVARKHGLSIGSGLTQRISKNEEKKRTALNRGGIGCAANRTAGSGGWEGRRGWGLGTSVDEDKRRRCEEKYTRQSGGQGVRVQIGGTRLEGRDGGRERWEKMAHPDETRPRQMHKKQNGPRKEERKTHHSPVARRIRPDDFSRCTSAPNLPPLADAESQTARASRQVKDKSSLRHSADVQRDVAHGKRKRRGARKRFNTSWESTRMEGSRTGSLYCTISTDPSRHVTVTAKVHWIRSSFLGNQANITINGNPADAEAEFLAFLGPIRSGNPPVTVTDTKILHFTALRHPSPEGSVEMVQ